MTYSYSKNAFRASLPKSVTTIAPAPLTTKQRIMAGTATTVISVGLTTTAHAGTTDQHISGGSFSNADVAISSVEYSQRNMSDIDRQIEQIVRDAERGATQAEATLKAKQQNQTRADEQERGTEPKAAAKKSSVQKSGAENPAAVAGATSNVAKTTQASANAKTSAIVNTKMAANAAANAASQAAAHAARHAASDTAQTAKSDTPFSISIEDQSDEEAASPHNVQVRVDTASTQPVLSVGLVEDEHTVMRGQPATFIGYSNYPSFIERTELRIFEDGMPTDSEPLHIVRGNFSGAMRWRPSDDVASELYYIYRVYGAEGRFDETRPRKLTVLNGPLKSKDRQPPRETFGSVDEANIRNIQTDDSATILVTGKAHPNLDLVQVSGQIVPVDDNGNFVSKQIIPQDSEQVDVQIGRGGKVNSDHSFDLHIPRNDWFFVGQGDLTFISSNGNGPAVEVSGDKLSDGDYITSRAAYYLSGKFGDGWKLTSSLDTGEMLLKDLFNNIDRKDPRQLLRRLNSNEFYPTYGDDSTLAEDAPTQTGFYARLEQGDSSIIVGNYIANFNQAELAQLDRGLFGALINYKSPETTEFGERKLELTAFASDPGTLPARDEMRGTGGSLYFLNRQDITIGSERLRIETRDRETGLVLSAVELRPQEDYDIDYFQGRITLSQPLASYAADGEIVRQGSSPGNIPVLVARYEFTPTVGDLDGYTVGTRGSAWVSDNVRLGISSQNETTESADQSLLAADILLRYAAGTYLKAELARTEGPGFGQSNSVDGGLSFTDFATPAVSGQSATAYRAEAGVNFAELAGKSGGPDGDMGQAGGYYEHFDGGFSSNGQLAFSDTERWGVHASVPIGQSTLIAAKYDRLTSDASGKTSAATAELTQRFNAGVSTNLALRHDERSPGTAFNSVEHGTRTDAALQVNYAPQASNWSVHAFGQVTLAGDADRSNNDRAGIGGKAELSDRLSFTGEVSEGDGGLGADARLTRQIGDGSELYIGYALLADGRDYGLEPQNLFSQSDAGTITVGARKRLSSALSVYGENRVGHGGTAPSLVTSFGLSFDPSEHWSFSGSFENGRIDDVETGIFKRTAATVGAGYSSEGIKISSQAEARFENGNGRDQEVWLFRNNVNTAMNADWRFLGRLNFALADNDELNVRAADFVEGVIGFAYRPVDNDRLNVLARYNYFQDLGPVGQVTQGGTTNSPKQVSQILSLDVNYDITKSVTIGGKYGYRQGKVSLDRTSDRFVSNDTHLGVIRADMHVVKNWDAMVEGRLLTNDIAGDTRYGVLAGIYRHIGDNAKIGVGYSFTDFSDDLTDQSYTSKGFFINVLGKI